MNLGRLWVLERVYILSEDLENFYENNSPKNENNSLRDFQMKKGVSIQKENKLKKHLKI